jgi:hypothetical protein
MTLDMGEAKLHFMETIRTRAKLDLHIQEEREDHKTKKVAIENVTLYFK